MVSSQTMTSHHKAIAGTKGIRNPAEYPVLGILLRGPLHGYDMCRRLGEGIGSDLAAGQESDLRSLSQTGT